MVYHKDYIVISLYITKYSFYKVHKNEKQYIVDNTDNVVLSSMLKINPLPLMTFLQYALSIRDNINIVFGRISRKYKW